MPKADFDFLDWVRETAKMDDTWTEMDGIWAELYGKYTSHRIEEEPIKEEPIKPDPDGYIGPYRPLWGRKQ